MPSIVVKSGSGRERVVRIGREPVIVGRNPSCSIRLDDRGVSRSHAEIVYQDGLWFVRDLGSSNGTQLNRKPVNSDKLPLKNGDVIQVGATTLRFVDEPARREQTLGRWTAEAEEIPDVPIAEEAPEEGVVMAEEVDEAPPMAEEVSEPPPITREAPAKTAPKPRPAAEEVPGGAAKPRHVQRPAASRSAPARKPSVPLPVEHKLDKVDLEAIEKMRTATDSIRAEVHKVIIGQDRVLEEVLTAMLSRGHCLMVGMPGLAKTLMVSTIAQVLDLKFKRVQFTPDLMPSDITGTDILEEDEMTGTKSFRFIRGPIFTNILLADEINRTPPKTQAALLEAMQEYRVTAAGHTYRLEMPFFVLATQNPLEQEGTYPLPEAQLDRFMFNIFVDYPEEHEEQQIVQATTYRTRPQPKKVLSGEDILNLQKIVRRVPVPDPVVQYAVRLVRASRPDRDGSPEFIHDYVHCGAGPRACQYLILAAKARAVLAGRGQAGFEDVRAAAIPVMRHRVFTNFNADSEGITTSHLIERLVKEVPEPANRNYRIVWRPPEAAADGPIELPAGDDAKVDVAAIRMMKEAAQRIRAEVGKIIIGQADVLDQVLMSMLSRGHCLMVGMPGLAKTLMVHTIAEVLDLGFKRIQFTPDLMPSDITGTDILEEDEKTRKKEFRFIKGPIFTNILLADEINRTPPKTQAALLEAMQEYRVTASGNTYDIPLPFFVLATQNPLEQEGTYPLPEAQLDRFMFNIWVDYPLEQEEEAIVKQTTRDLELSVNKVMGGEAILRLQDIVRRVPVSSHVVKYATALVRASRPGPANKLDFINEWVHCGAGPRACQYLILGAKSRAVIDGRANVSCNDVRASAIPVLRHRIYTNFNADSEGVGAVDIIKRLLESVPEPSEKEYRAARASGRGAWSKPGTQAKAQAAATDEREKKRQ